MGTQEIVRAVGNARAKRVADNLARKAVLNAMAPGGPRLGAERYPMRDGAVLVVEARYDDGQVVLQWLQAPWRCGPEAQGRDAYEAACTAIAAHLDARGF